MLYYGKTDVGAVRNNNQDSFAIKEYSPELLLAIVCDGIGGASGGSVASRIACDSFVAEFDECVKEINGDIPLLLSDEEEVGDILRDCVYVANKAVYKRSREDVSLRGMGTTLVASLITPQTVYTVNVGDSRMYLIRKENIKQITRDHSYVQYLIDIGKISPDDAKRSPNRNIITRAVGTEGDIEADVFVTNIITENENGSGSTYTLLCTDGLTNHLSSDDILKAVSRSKDAPVTADAIKNCVDSLVDSAITAGGSDNITVVLAAL